MSLQPVTVMGMTTSSPGQIEPLPAEVPMAALARSQGNRQHSRRRSLILRIMAAYFSMMMTFDFTQLRTPSKVTRH